MGRETSSNKDSLDLLSPTPPPTSSNDANQHENNNINCAAMVVDGSNNRTSAGSMNETTPQSSSMVEPALESPQPSSQQPDNVTVVLAAELAPNREAVTERVTQQLQEQIASQWQERIHQVVQDRLNAQVEHQDFIDNVAGDVGGERGKKEMVQVVAVPLGEEGKVAARANNASSRGWIIWGAVLVLAAILVGVAVVLVLRNNGDSNIPVSTQFPTGDTNTSSTTTLAPSVAPTESNPRWIYLVETLEPFFSENDNDGGISGGWLELVQTTPLSPQAQGLRWMATVDDFSNPPEHIETTILLERYVAATLYYYYGHNGNEDEWSLTYLDPTLSVCQWNLGTNILQDSAQGLFCTDFEHHGSITYVLLQELGFAGTIPSELGLLEHLLGVHLYTNVFTGTLPTNLPSSLVDLELANNRLSGTLPSTWAVTLPNVETIWVENNRLSGTIPSDWQAMVEMEWFDLASNQISGTIPSFLGSNMTKLEYLYLEYNDLSGTLPSEIALLSSLQHLLIQGNVRLEGSVPNEYANLSGSLDVFWLEDTSLTGSLNDIFCNGSSSSMDRPTLKADCLGDDSEMECFCCDYCCTPDGVDCEFM